VASTALLRYPNQDFWDNFGVTRFLAVSDSTPEEEVTNVVLVCEVVRSCRRNGASSGDVEECGG